MELKNYLSILRDRWLSALLTALLVLGAVVGATLLQQPTYQATNRVFVQTQAGSTVTDLQQGATFARQQITSYADLAKSPLVLDPVVSTLGLDTTAQDLSNEITVTVPPETLILEITATSKDPREAAAIANQTADSLATAVSGLESTAGESRVELTTISPATAPTRAASPNIPRNVAVGVILALLAGLGVALLRDLIDNRVRRASDITTQLGQPVLASIPASKDARHYPLVAAQKPQSLQAEAFRELRTNLQFVGLSSSSRSIVTTSSLPGEGKSSTSINVAHVLAQSGLKVLLIDADLRRPSLHEYLGVEGGAGLTTALIGDADWEDVIQPLDQQGVDLLASGPVPPNPSEMLGSAQMAVLLEQVQAAYDFVVVDTAPLLAVTDAAVLSKLVGGVLLVAQSERVRRPQAAQSVQKLKAVNAPILGVVLNRVRHTGHDYYAYDYRPKSDEARMDRSAVERPASADAASRVDTGETPTRHPRLSPKGGRHARRDRTPRPNDKTWIGSRQVTEDEHR